MNQPNYLYHLAKRKIVAHVRRFFLSPQPPHCKSLYASLLRAFFRFFPSFLWLTFPVFRSFYLVLPFFNPLSLLLS
ncbi:hypothetical protein L218DRAFT_454182 [Marasmius fiardii PR-910]|nr:hypothetical protein L218DRAFT_454182 [Marasmius fiardii PR-910]